MLDQNTDRMWFVIGAVIVGAAIIFLANGALPNLFASVTELFDESAQGASVTIDLLDAENVFDINTWERGGINGMTGERLNTDWWRNKRVRRVDRDDVRAYSRLHVSFNSADYTIGLVYYDEDGEFMHQHRWIAESGVYDLPDSVHYVWVTAAPSLRDGDGNDRGVTLNELEAINVTMHWLE